VCVCVCGGGGGQEDHHAEETYRAMTASLVQEQQGAKDLVEVANRLQDRFFCVYLHDPMVKTKNIEAMNSQKSSV
jgi:hypothetical protein